MSEQKDKTKGSGNNFIFYAVPAVLIAYFVNRFAAVIINNKIPLQDVPNGSTFSLVLKDIVKHPFYLSFAKIPLISTIAILVLFVLIALYQSMEDKNFRGIEQGSALWGGRGTITKYLDPYKGRYDRTQTNMILTDTEGMSLNTRKTMRNNNVLVIGGTGSGKTRFFVKPNLMQMQCSYAITDPKGEILRECGKMLMENGYDIKIFDLIDMEHSARYNPFEYIKDETDILKLIDNLITNTTPPGAKTGDPFWEKSETALLQAFFGYILFELPKKDQNIGTVMELLTMSEIREDEEGFQSDTDKLFAKLAEREPNHFAVKQYHIFKLAGGTKTAKSILISVGVRLAAWNIPQVRSLMSEDTVNLPSLGEKKTVLFIIVPDSTKAFNFIAAMMYQQLFDVLYYKADYQYGGQLPQHVRFLLDEFANIGKIPNFEQYLATMRSREISASIIIQNLSQLKTMFGGENHSDAWETILGNCDTVLYLGGREQTTLKYLSEIVGKTTIDIKNSSQSYGQQGSWSNSIQKQGRELMTPDEIARIGTNKCILLIRGERPFFSDKYVLTNHQNYKQLAEVTGEFFRTQDKGMYELRLFFSK
jgi:type IV secretion system protein VirD4